MNPASLCLGTKGKENKLITKKHKMKETRTHLLKKKKIENKKKAASLRKRGFVSDIKKKMSPKRHVLVALQNKDTFFSPPPPPPPPPPRWGQNPYFFEAFRFFWIYAQSTRKPPKISGQRWFWGVVWGCSIGETPQRYKKMEKNSKNRPFWPFGPYWSKWPFLTNISKKKQNFVIIRPVWAQICPKNVPRVHSDLF